MADYSCDIINADGYLMDSQVHVRQLCDYIITGIGGTSEVVYYKMCARSLDNTSWQVWFVSTTPDFTGSQYAGGTPINTSTIFILAVV